MAHPDADKDVGEQPQAVAPDNGSKRPIWHRPSLTKTPVKDIILANVGSFIDGASGSEIG
jgi:hypothetical protein